MHSPCHSLLFPHFFLVHYLVYFSTDITFLFDVNCFISICELDISKGSGNLKNSLL